MSTGPCMTRFELSAMHVACFVALILGVPVESARPALQQQMSTGGTLEYDDVCCCKRHKDVGKTLRKPGHTEDMQRVDCQKLKQMRPDRPFWWHFGSGDSEKRCCWTSSHNCMPTIGFLSLNEDGGRRIDDKDRESLCQTGTTPEGDVEPIDKTFAFNEIMGSLYSDIGDMVVSKLCGMVSGGLAAHGPGHVAQCAQAHRQAGSLQDAGRAAMGKAFEGAIGQHFASTRHPIMPPTEWFRYGGDRPLEVAKSVQVFNGNKFPNMRYWFHPELQENGHVMVVFQDPNTYVPPDKRTRAPTSTSGEGFCGQDALNFEKVCVQTTESGELESLTVNLDLNKELDVTAEVPL
ncbi:unnamed protein product [Symbiodinium microadriaticum]|nr:unnamed protein product [Symbiodinium microadriaticum]CAE7642432.1 unnamed protein product [Symbiodinium sp. KB8]